MSGKLPTFMTYAAEFELWDFGSQVKKVFITKTQKKEDVQELQRKFMVNKMRTGQQMVWFCETMVPTFSDYDSAISPLKDLMFKRDKLQTDFKTLVKPEEDHDIHNTKGCFALDPKFSQIVLCDMSDPDCDDEIVQMLLDQVPNIEEFKCVYVEGEE